MAYQFSGRSKINIKTHTSQVLVFKVPCQYQKESKSDLNSRILFFNSLIHLFMFLINAVCLSFA